MQIVWSLVAYRVRYALTTVSAFLLEKRYNQNPPETLYNNFYY